jgi:hypothetical protein
MRGVGVNPVGVRRVTVFSFVIERTFPEAAEQTPRPRAGSAQAAGVTNDHAQVAWRTPITDESWRLRVRGADGSRATSIRAGGDAPDTRGLFVKPGSERPFYTTVHR